MARPSFLTDEHIANAVAIGLRARGIDATTAAEARQLGASDTALLAFAMTQSRVLITADPDHLRRRMPGSGFSSEGAMLIAEVLTAEEMVNRVELL